MNTLGAKLQKFNTRDIIYPTHKKYSSASFSLLVVLIFKVANLTLFLYVLLWREAKATKIKIAYLPNNFKSVKIFTRFTNINLHNIYLHEFCTLHHQRRCEMLSSWLFLFHHRVLLDIWSAFDSI